MLNISNIHVAFIKKKTTNIILIFIYNTCATNIVNITIYTTFKIFVMF